MTTEPAPERARTRPTARAGLVALLTALVYGAGANIGAGPVLALAAGMAAGAVWSAVTFTRHARRFRVLVPPAHRTHEGRGALPATVTAPRGALGVVTLTGPLPVAEADALLATLGQQAPRCPDGDHPAHWAPLPHGGTTAEVRLPVLLARGPGQRLTVVAELTDALGLVRRRVVAGEVLVDVLPAAGVAAPFSATSVEEDVEDRPAHTLAANGPPGTELRPWRPGEPIRAVHWPASQRVGEVLLRPRSPETTQTRTLAVEDRAWTRTELDERCRDVAATADALTARDVTVEVEIGGRTLPWGDEARLALASLSPHAGDAAWG